MTITFTKLTPERHSVRCLRADGTSTETELETRSFFRHDLSHYCVEKAAGKPACFWGTVAMGTGFDQLGRAGDYGAGVLEGPDIMELERVVAVLQGVTKLASGESAEHGKQVYETLKQAFATQSEPVPSYLSQEFVEKVSAELIELNRRWESLRVSGTLILEW